MYTPYPRQQEAIEKMTAFLNSKTTKKGIFVYPTSFGKSLIIANVAMKFPEKYFINIAPKKELVEQNYKTYKSYGFTASICSASLDSDEIGKVTFATIGTLKKHVDFLRDKDVVLLADECHNSSLRGSTLDIFFRGIRKAKLVGVTATPLRLANGQEGSQLKMMNRMQDCIYSSIEDVVQISEAIDTNLWSPLLYEVEDIDEKALRLNTTGSDYTLKSLEAFSEANDIPDKCATAWNRLKKEGRDSCIIYTSTIDEAVTVSNKIKGSAVLHSKIKKKERKLIVDGFKKGEIQVIVNVGILIEGFDYPKLSSIILARPTNSITIYYQSIGRLVRKHKDKKDGKIIDLSGNFNKFGKVEGINFEKSKYWGGWGAFSGEKLLTRIPMSLKNPPTKQQLKEKYEQEQNYFKERVKPINGKSNELMFGKHKGKTVKELFKTKRWYLEWIYTNEDFSYPGKNGHLVKKEINELFNTLEFVC